MLNKEVARKINLITIIAVYFLILVGGIVRSMDSGMGCPDWPKCFGALMPPTNAQNLPIDYQENFLEKRIEKNNRLSRLLGKIGFDGLAQKVTYDQSIYKSEVFSVKTAWIEYINRLIGVLIGLFIIANLILSYQFDRRIIRSLALSSFILVLFQGWIGSLVVSTNLLPGFISFHMFLALLLVSLLIIQWVFSREFKNKYRNLRVPLVVLFLLFFLQVFMGVNVREQIDHLKETNILRVEWISELDNLFYIHRSFSILIMCLIGYLIWKTRIRGSIDSAFASLSIIVLVEVLIGAVMAYFELPFLTQPFHLLFGSLAFGLIVYLLSLSFIRIKSY